jgi:hypothetical protein
VRAERLDEQMSDDEALALADLRLADEEDASLSELLKLSGEGALDSDGQRELDEMMGFYERVLLRKSQALRVAVQRDLRASRYGNKRSRSLEGKPTVDEQVGAGAVRLPP